MKVLFATALLMASVSAKVYDVKDFKTVETEGFRYRSPITSFTEFPSADLNQWDSSSQVGCTMGFTVFFLAYFYTIFAIIVDIRQRAADYDEKIGDAM
tara:strand:- start:387 stop:680 length:294 start_codon:yes stop_codon:yes gene_type:complete